MSIYVHAYMQIYSHACAHMTCMHMYSYLHSYPRTNLHMRDEASPKLQSVL